MANIFNPTVDGPDQNPNATLSEWLTAAVTQTNLSGRVDRALTRMVKDRMYGYRRESGQYYDTTSSIADGVIQF